MDDRRQQARIHCFAIVELWIAGEQKPVMGALVNTSMGGCYVESTVPLKVGTRVEVAVSANQARIALAGNVLGTSRGLGVRIRFSDPDQAKLKLFLDSLTQKAQEYETENSYVARLKGR
jgi:hypothetical protein